MSRALTREPPSPPVLAERLALVDAVDHLLNRGVVLVGGATISLAGVDLVYLGLNVLVSSVETLRREGSDSQGGPVTLLPPPGPGRPAPPPSAGPRLASEGSGHAPGHPSPALPAGGEGAGAPLGTGRPPPASGGREGGRPFAGPATSTTAASEATSAERPEQGLARLVLTLVELLRQVIERQAVRRMEGGRLTDEDVERMGLALMELEAKMAELRDVFGLRPADLNVDLGPLGNLL